LETLAVSLLSRGALSVFLDPGEKRYHSLLEKVKAHSIEGVVFVYPKYCDPMAFDYPEIQTFLRKEGIPSLFVELEFDYSFQTRFRRHLEVFVEMLERKISR
jgi:benzoyl-CoA reductase/2-hydroxyglutaryl-CoA dehydratase subunit BcrC/BadD/HgdB